MEKIKTLIKILFFLLLISTITSIGTYISFGFEIFKYTLGLTYIASSLFIFSQFVLIMLETEKL